MMRTAKRYFRGIILVLAIYCGSIAASELSLGSKIALEGKAVTVLSCKTLPYVMNDYSKRFRFDTSANPKLKELRERYRLEEVVVSGTDEFDRQVRLMDWAHNRFKEFGQPSTSTRGALDILEGIDAGHAFFCTQYAQLFASAAASLGWVDRVLALRRHQGAASNGTTEHSTTEIWSNQHRKWVMLDPTSNMYLEKDGVPLNAWEIRQEWFYKGGRDLVWVIGKDRKKYRKADLPVFLKHFPGFGDLTVPADELDKYGFIGYIPNTDLMDSGFDYGQMFIVKDELCEGTRWHTRDLPKDPANEPYFPIGQAALEIETEGQKLGIRIKTLTPNLNRFEVKFDGGSWRETSDIFDWKVRSGTNRVEVRTVNDFGVQGPTSVIELRVD